MFQVSKNSALVGFLATLAIITLRSIVKIVGLKVSRGKSIQQHGCMPTAKYPHTDIFFGLDDIWATLKAAKAKGFLARIRRQYDKYGNTYSARFLTYPVINTIEPENIRTVLSSRFADYGVGSRRKEAFKPLLGKSIILLDGHEWQRSRARLRPNFTKSQVTDLARIETHVRHLIHNIPADGTTVDLATLFFRLTPDISTEFLLGESIGSLVRPDSQDAYFAQAFERAQAGSEHRWRLGSLAKFVPQPQFFRDVANVHDYINGHVEKALEHHRSREMKGSLSQMDHQKDQTRYVFLHQLLTQTQDRDILRDEILSVFLAGRDTTASLLCNCFFVLARRPDIWAEIRKEIEYLDGKPPTLSQLNGLKTVRNSLNECMYQSLLSLYRKSALAKV